MMVKMIIILILKEEMIKKIDINQVQLEVIVIGEMIMKVVIMVILEKEIK